MEQLKNVLKLLNEEQRLAVQQIDGPVMVVAGPGTGKTQLLSARVANILDKTDTNPRNILCLTFTNKAATNMRERMTDIIGPEARHVNVKTFHSFAAEIMNMYPDYFWNGARLSTVPESVQLDIIQNILKKLPLDNPLALRFAGQFTAVKPVQEGLKLAKEAGLTPDMLKSLVTANLAYIDLIEPDLVEVLDATISKKRIPAITAAVDNLPHQAIDRQKTFMQPLDEVISETYREALAKDEAAGTTKHISRWKSSWLKSQNGSKGLHDERKRNQWWLELAEVYDQYRNELHSRGYFDYADMLVEVIATLSSDQALREEIQEQFLYVLIDEFQDTNPAQMRLAHLIADHPAADGKPNLMVVGDDDQSIFKFNGAELNNLLNFRHDYQVEKPIVLTKNYRSTQAVLDTAKQVIEKAQDRLVTREPDITKELTAVTDIPSGEISLQRYKTQEHQFSEVADAIALRKENYPTETIAVLARGHSSLQALAARLHDRNVPIDYERQRDILRHPATQVIMMLLELIHAIAQGDKAMTNVLLAKTLRHPMWGIPTESLWQLALKNKARPNWLQSIRREDVGLAPFADWLEWLAANTNEMPVASMIEHVLGLRESELFTSPFKSYYLSHDGLTDQYLETLSAVQKIRHLADEFGAEGSLESLLRLIEISKDNQVVLNDESPFLSGKNAVSLLTVHKAKGMEFDTVYIIDAVEANWKPRNAGRKPPANLPLKSYGDTEDDYVRLLYVALTRAKRNILIGSYGIDAAGEKVLTTPLLHGTMPVQDIEPSEETTLQVLEDAVRWPVLAQKSEKQLLLPHVSSYQMSVTALINFLDVTKGGPAYFRERNILRLPEIKTMALSYGTAVHAALEHAQILTNKGQFDLEPVVRTLHDALAAEHITPDEYSRYCEKGSAMLENLFNDYAYRLPAGSRPERSFSDVSLGEARLGGKLDRVDVTPNGIEVIDYKTGSYLRSFSTKSKSIEIKAWKHKLQLVFYALLIKESGQYDDMPVKGTMVYVEADDNSKLLLTYEPSQEEIDELKDIISCVYRRIVAAEFPATDTYSQDLAGIQQFITDLQAGTI